ncbi:MAG: hypothetical protein K0S63_720 [Gammaproteobacteria bacterium]|jgi:uncharacterized protein (TIGR02284 family)|nr:hypothetical protein [Gammaproteobacteria bacterium]
MKTENNTIVQELCEKLLDSRNGYAECAEKTKDIELKQCATRLTSERQKMLDELRSTAEKLNYELPSQTGSVSAALHRVFIDLKSLLTGGNKEAIEREIERGEQILIDAYQTALDKYALPPALRDLLQRQLGSIKQEVKTLPH